MSLSVAIIAAASIAVANAAASVRNVITMQTGGVNSEWWSFRT